MTDCPLCEAGKPRELIYATVIVDGTPVIFPLAKSQFDKIKKQVEEMRLPWWRRTLLRLKRFFTGRLK